MLQLKERRLVWISGKSKDALPTLLAYLQNDLPTASERLAEQRKQGCLWVGASLPIAIVNADFELCTPGKARQRIGTEYRTIVYDAFHGLDVDSVAAISGTLVHGGVFYLLSPHRSEWPDADSTELQRYSVHGKPGDNTSQRSSVYIKWLIQCLDAHTHAVPEALSAQQLSAQEITEDIRAIEVRQSAKKETAELQNSAQCTLETQGGKAASDSNSVNNPDVEINVGTDSGAKHLPNADQSNILTKWVTELALARPDFNKPVDLATDSPANARVRVVTADRGRGKSALLGMLCAEAFAAGKSCIVTAPSRRSAGILLHHFDSHLQAMEYSEKESRDDIHRAPQFIPPDELVTKPAQADLVLVDEAAALPLPVLQQLIENYHSLVLATTVHGYEGAGRGFAIRLRQWLSFTKIAYSWRTLQTPIRWPAGDKLEAFCNQAFLLDAEYATLDQPPVPSGPCDVEYFSAQQLLENKSLLRQCFALLVQAHYQTKPMDLRHMLDGQNILVFGLRRKTAIVGTALIALEGFACRETDTGLGRAIIEKQRRPRGHLLPQLLAQWTINERALNLNIARVVRIAIHPQWQNQGLGTQFLGELEKQLSNDFPVNAFGAVFGGDNRVINFWERAGYRTFHVGRRRNNRSGERSAALIKPAEQSPQAREALNIIDRAWQLHAINTAEDTNKPADSETTREMVGAYININRSFHDSRAFIKNFLRNRLADDGSTPDELTDEENRLAREALSEDFQFKRYASEYGLVGKKAAEIAFKQVLEKLYK